MKSILLASLFLAVISMSSCRKYCPSCSPSMEQIKQGRVEVLLREILDKLGLPFAPNITRKNIPRIPPVVKLLESNVMEPNEASDDTEEDHYHSKTQRIILFPSPEHPLVAQKAANCCYFSFIGKAGDPSLRIHKAKLEIYVRRKPNATQKSLAGPKAVSTINVYQRHFPISQGTPRRMLVASKPLKPGKDESWYVFKIRSVVKGWKRHPNRNLGLDLEIQGDDSYEIVQDKDSSFQPFLEVYIKNKKKQRRKRSVGLECGKGSREKRCCRFPLVIDFNKIGWNFVIAPRRFLAYFCTGECDDSILPQYPHAHFVRQMTENRSIACCAPSKMSSITMLFFDNDQTILYEELKSVIALSCGCL